MLLWRSNPPRGDYAIFPVNCPADSVSHATFPSASQFRVMECLRALALDLPSIGALAMRHGPRRDEAYPTDNAWNYRSWDDHRVVGALAAAAPTRPMPEVTPCDPCLLLLLVVLLVQEVLKLLGCEQILGAALLPSPLPLY